jgi:hypothetical protein
LAVACLICGSAEAAQAPRVEQGGRNLRRRAITIDESSLTSLPVVNVAPGLATVLAFKAPIRDGGAILSKAGDLFYAPTQTDRTVVIVPRQAVSAPVNLNVTMSDGTVVSFALVTRGKDVDVQVDVTIALRDAADSSAALKAEVALLSERLKECQSTGATRIAELILAQGYDAPQSFDTRSIRGGDKQNRLLVQARRLYHMFGHTFLVVSVENRDPSRNWILDKPTVRLAGGGQDVELTVTTWQADQPELAPDAEARVVIGFTTPKSIHPRQRLEVTLTERSGGRRFELKDLEM